MFRYYCLISIVFLTFDLFGFHGLFTIYYYYFIIYCYLFFIGFSLLFYYYFLKISVLIRLETICRRR